MLRQDQRQARSTSIPVEPAACPTLTKGPFAYDHGDTAGYDAAAAHAQPGAHLRAAAHARRRPALPRHGARPSASSSWRGCSSRRPTARWPPSRPACWPPAPRASSRRPKPTTRSPAWWTWRAKAKEEGKEKVILFNWSGHGLIDLGSYEKYLSGQIKDFEFPAQDIEEAEKILAKYPKPQVMKSR
ncbi:MAG: hypothetical protein MZV70_64445 [Desulfobacterales bacterium]|nr:hypothetical protein [Desulfobacterales bacterium]